MKIQTKAALINAMNKIGDIKVYIYEHKMVSSEAAMYMALKKRMYISGRYAAVLKKKYKNEYNEYKRLALIPDVR